MEALRLDRTNVKAMFRQAQAQTVCWFVWTFELCKESAGNPRNRKSGSFPVSLGVSVMHFVGLDKVTLCDNRLVS